LTGKQILLVASALVIVSILFYLGFKTSSVKKNDTEAPAALPEFNFQSYLNESKNRIPEELKGRILLLEEKKSDQESLVTLSRIWDSLNYPAISAQYALELAEVQPDENNWYVAGSKFYTVASMSNDSSLQQLAASNAQKAFEKVLQLNPNNLDAKNALGILYIQVNNDVMKGVGMLKEVVSKDSNNLQAIFTLGMLSIQSGQLDKAEQRFKKLISLQPFNAEYYYYLAEVYGKLGQKEKAIKTYETCKSLLKDNESKKEIESLIKQLKNT
jgi:tetratricopeptide (TPR) repeat protein